MKLLAVFEPLRIKDGFVLRAYQYREGGNGNGVVWAMPLDTTFPNPDYCLRLEDRFLAPPKPTAAVDDVMEVIEGDGSPWSYLCASLLGREIYEFGAMWHGCSWGTHKILGKNPWAANKPSKRTWEDMLGDRAKWTWQESEPTQWSPQVTEDKNTMKVMFFTFSGLDMKMIYQHTDTFQKGRYCFTTHCIPIATGGRGYIY
jgi:hypothetical protein